jgi:hypothetical protein
VQKRIRTCEDEIISLKTKVNILITLNIGMFIAIVAQKWW